MRKLLLLISLVCLPVYGADLVSSNVTMSDVKMRADYTDWCADDSCMACFRFNEGVDDNVIDESGNDELATKVNGVLLTTDNCKEGGCFDFDGTDDYIRLWGSYTAVNFALAVRRDEGLISAYISNGWVIEDTGNTIPQNEYCHYCFTTAQSGDSYIYFNGEQIGTHSNDLNANRTFCMWARSESESTADRERLFNFVSTSDLRLGYYSSANNDWNGQIDELIIFSRVLTQDEIQDIYKNGLR